MQINAPSRAARRHQPAADGGERRPVACAATYDHPLLFGRAEVERGEAIFEGKRYLVTSGTIDFTNPSKIEPFFDIDAETRVRAPGQTYIVDIRI